MGEERTGPTTGSESGLLRWILLDGNRFLIAAGILAVSGLVLAALTAADVVGFTNESSINRLANGMVAGTFSVVTIVITINQLILSRQFAAASQLRERLDGVMELREDIAQKADVHASPAEPTALLEVVMSAVEDRAIRLGETVAEENEREREVSEYARTVAEAAGDARDRLDDADFGTFHAVSLTIDYDDSQQIYAGRYLQNEHAEGIDEETDEALTDLLETLQLFNVARSHFKTTYMERELSRLSRLITYLGIPAILAALSTGLLYGDRGGLTVSPEIAPQVIIPLILVVLSPLALLSAFVLRSATVTRRTASIGPMVPNKEVEEGTAASTDVTEH
ncbi:hypothetical protein [Halalkalicoccus jeotgali]|uniref:Uncharacterized protein n=1 Tax=Halalkalicoccus jeotgali (strain DSM 18796 / CECT 7217 / JCM 14584 / KCTC 4019 / B3) TaxID=795797 RepID=D8JAE1_HALJB|nr:hypothetical protein [Halalkalicoccus jeotgali]ADJ14663.1 hypothetical protein HacjB3_06360 [Halalkalicoccus jeotgali B3]ELY39561.1 hypothetical protein C497_04757 [Halalkalicoccus jeotgali B3]